MNIYYEPINKAIIEVSHGLLPKMDHLSMVIADLDTADPSWIYIDSDGMAQAKQQFSNRLLEGMVCGVPTPLNLPIDTEVYVDDLEGQIYFDTVVDSNFNLEFATSGIYEVTFNHAHWVSLIQEIVVK